MRLAAKLHKVDAVLITNTVDIRYLTGCTEGAGALLMAPKFEQLFMGKMYEDVIPKQAPGIECVLPKKGLYDGVMAVLRKHKHNRALGFQGNNTTWAQYSLLEKSAKRRKLVSVADLVLDYRAVKDDDEIKLIKKCVVIAEKGLLELVSGGAKYFIGKSEKQIAADLEYAMRNFGADRQGFENMGIIVASGANSASCHHMPTGRKVRKGDTLLIDWGAELDGYRSDITRTLFIGKAPGKRMTDIYETVLAANAAGVAAMKPRVRCQSVAKTAWDVVKNAGYGETIRHGLGHGLGLNVHERPGFGNGSLPRNGKDVALRSNMVLTIEPGIYYDGFGGVRIEDDVVVTPKGRKCLTSFPRNLNDVIVA
jgi:Xaa-Pro aminopeptidase